MCLPLQQVRSLRKVRQQNGDYVKESNLPWTYPASSPACRLNETVNDANPLSFFRPKLAERHISLSNF